MELKELTDKTLELFEVKSVEQLGQQLLEVSKGTDKLEAFCNLVGGDLTQDWMQKIYQYYLADRKEKKQDYTPETRKQIRDLAKDGKSAREISELTGVSIPTANKYMRRATDGQET